MSAPTVREYVLTRRRASGVERASSKQARARARAGLRPRAVAGEPESARLIRQSTESALADVLTR
jgi:hypothetical protein